MKIFLRLPASAPAVPVSLNRTLTLLVSLLFAFSSGAALAQLHQPDYKTIVVFGDSLSDTGNVAHLTQLKYGVRVPSLQGGDYTDGRFTDGFDTIPPAHQYSGVWIEQLAALLPSHPTVTDSLDGGTDYAYGFAFTGSGTAPLTFGPSNAFSVTIDNIGLQITTYLATHPKIDDKTLFVVWGGANDVLSAQSPDDVFTAAVNEAFDIQRLIDAGATQFIIPNLPPLGLTPRLNGSPVTATPANQASVLFNDVLNLGVTILRDFNPGRRLQLHQLDVFSAFEQIVAAPWAFSFANVKSASQGLPVDPDTYLFWDDLHPTTHGHNILALTAWRLLADSGCPVGFRTQRDQSCRSETAVPSLP